jgi:[acyl-carrier-protein] S-malonyltransferase
LVAGYSVGDLTAHAVAGAISVDDALALADARGRAMDRAAQARPAPLGMAGVRGVSEMQIRSILPADVKVALVNGRDHIVIGGPQASLDAVEQMLLAAGAHVRRLGVTVASHTFYMSEAADEFRRALLRHDWNRPLHRLLSPIDGAAVTTREKAVDCLSRQIAERLDWASAMEALGEYGVKATLELGTGRALSAMITEATPSVTARSVDDFKTVNGLSQWIVRHG